MAEGYSIPAQYVTSSMNIANGTAVEVIFARHFKLLEVRTFVSVVTATATETMTVTRRPVAGQTTPTPVDIGTFPIVADLAVGSELRCTLAGVADTLFNPGESCAITGGNSTGTGTVYFGLIGYHYDGDNLNPQVAFTTTSSKAVSGGAGSVYRVTFTTT